MPSIEMLTINETHEDVEEIINIIWRAIEYFPNGLWNEINYLGNANIRYDVKVKFKETMYSAFIFDRLIEKIRRIKRTLQIRDLLLAVTRDPVIAVYHRLEAKKIRRAANIVYDYMSTDVGIVSLFNIEEKAATKVTAHGLGHSRGLRHHTKPIDIMYERLLGEEMLMRDGFCNDCLRRIMTRNEGKIGDTL